MAHESKELTKRVRGQMARRHVDVSMVNVNCVGSTVYLTGVLRAIRTNANVDLREEMETIGKLLRAMPGVREVVWDVNLRT